MLAYLVVGMVVQIVVFIERYIRMPEIYQSWWSEGKAWLIFIGFIAINVVLWPISIICEIINVVHGE